MDNQDKIFEKIKKASQKAEEKDFPGMEKVWARVEEKLDKKEDKRTILLWKKIAVAASLLLVISLGYQFLKTDKNSTLENTDKVVTTETPKESSKNNSTEKEQTIVSSDSQLITKEKAEKILENQIKNKESVAIHEPTSNIQTESYNMPASVDAAVAVAEPSKDEKIEDESDKMLSKKEVLRIGYSSRPQRESASLAFADKQTLQMKQSAPLVILNGKALAHNDEAKRDKMMQAEMENLKPENVESLVILDEPLYIIDGIYYSENDLFGENPTSPYAPLNQQDIKTITILQDIEAVEKYGEKGKKGVVIITTKTGKPTPKK